MTPGCSYNASSNSNNNVEHAEKHQIALTLSNYDSYLDLRQGFYGNDYYFIYYYFDGALDYAYYDNVVIDYEYSYTDGFGTKKIVSKSLKLNVGGYGLWYTKSGSGYTYKVTNASGSVIYWL